MYFDDLKAEEIPVPPSATPLAAAPLSSSPVAAGSTPPLGGLQRGTSLPKLTASGNVLLWIDPDRERRNEVTVAEMKEIDPRLQVVQCTSSHEAKAWLQRETEVLRLQCWQSVIFLLDDFFIWRQMITALVQYSSLRVMTNRFRQGDGDELAGTTWIAWMRSQRALRNVPVMLFCGKDAFSRVSGAHDPQARVFVTYLYQDALDFGSFRTAIAPGSPGGSALNRLKKVLPGRSSSSGDG